MIVGHIFYCSSLIQVKVVVEVHVLREVRVDVRGVIDDCVVVLHYHVRVVSWGTHWVVVAVKVHLIQPIQGMLHHQLSQLLVLHLVVAIWIEVGKLGVSS